MQAVDASRSSGLQIGDHNVQHNIIGGSVTMLPPAREVTWPVRVGVIPPLATSFQPRDQSARLDPPAGGRGLARTQVLSGLGGVGKTQLAVRYAREQGSAADLLIWVNATSRISVLTAFAETATRLGCPVANDAEQAAGWLLDWCRTATRPWMIVLDDVRDPADLRGLWPEGLRGRILVTTRRTDSAFANSGRERIDLGLFTPDQAVAYLADRLGLGEDAERNDAAGLAADLGHLPLALALAATFIVDRGDTSAGYRRRLADRRRHLDDLFPHESFADDYPHRLAATWSISIRAADTLRPVGVSRLLLELAGMLEPGGIPTAVLVGAAARTYVGFGRARQAGDRRVSEVDCRDALHHLARFNLVSLERGSDGASGWVGVHALVQRAAVERLPQDRRDRLARASADALREAWPDVERDTRLAEALRANAAALIERSGDALWLPESHPVLWRAGRSLGECGLVHPALDHFTVLRDTSARLLGPDHRDTLRSRHHLGYWQGESGHPSGAASELALVLADQLRTLGPNHLDTLATRANQAIWRGVAGDTVGAAAALTRLLADQQHILGSDHPDTLTTRHHLAARQGEDGHAAGAAAAFGRLLTDMLRVLGPDHPHALTTRAHLAAWSGAAGNPAYAATAFAQLLIDRVRILGPDHPATLSTRANLAYWHGAAGNPAGATAAYEQVLADRVRVLGPDHPATLRTRANLAYWRGATGDHAGGATAYAEVLDDMLRVLGPDHPDTLTTRADSASLQARAGDTAGAVAALDQLVPDVLRILGSGHPESRNMLAELRRWHRQVQRSPGSPSRPTGSRGVVGSDDSGT